MNYSCSHVFWLQQAFGVICSAFELMLQRLQRTRRPSRVDAQDPDSVGIDRSAQAISHCLERVLGSRILTGVRLGCQDSARVDKHDLTAAVPEHGQQGLGEDIRGAYIGAVLPVEI